MFRVGTNNLGRVGKSEAHVYFIALTCSDEEQLGKPFLLQVNFENLISSLVCRHYKGQNAHRLIRVNVVQHCSPEK